MIAIFINKFRIFSLSPIAGRTQANYTIRVIVKEEPVVEEALSFPNEIFLVVIGGAIVICLVLVICCSVLICRCKKQTQNSGSNTKKKKKRAKGKEVSFQLPSSQKCVAIANDINSSLVCSKINGNLTITDSNQQEMLLYLGNNTQNISINDMSLQGHCGPQDRNPDLINDAESLRQRNECDMKQNQRAGDESDMEKGRSHQPDNPDSYSLVPILRPIPARFSAMSTLPRGGSGVARDMYQVDVHLNPGCFVDPNGYPVEYSLAQMPVINQAPVNYSYQTLPHNRAGKNASNSVVRFANEAEFITRTSQTFQTYSPDVRYTAEGYPCIDSNGAVFIDTQNFPSPPEGYKTDNLSSLPTVTTLVNNQGFCPNSQLAMHQQQASTAPKWPSCMPAGYHPQLIAIDTQNVRFQMSPQQLQSPSSQGSMSVTKKCVGATQTSEQDSNVIHEEEEEEEDGDEGEECGSSGTKCRQLKGPLADSPDEGYVGDSHESSDI